MLTYAGSNEWGQLGQSDNNSLVMAKPVWCDGEIDGVWAAGSQTWVLTRVASVEVQTRGHSLDDTRAHTLDTPGATLQQPPAHAHRARGGGAGARGTDIEKNKEMAGVWIAARSHVWVAGRNDVC
jgi:hypothetical protein